MCGMTYWWMSWLSSWEGSSHSKRGGGVGVLCACLFWVLCLCFAKIPWVLCLEYVSVFLILGSVSVLLNHGRIVYWFHTVTHCNILQRSATYCRTLQLTTRSGFTIEKCVAVYEVCCSVYSIDNFGATEQKVWQKCVAVYTPKSYVCCNVYSKCVAVYTPKLYVCCSVYSIDNFVATE